VEKKALGRGLEALLPESASKATSTNEESHQIRVEHIHPNPYQPRQSFAEDETSQLSDSIKKFGVIQPVIVRRKGDGFFELIAGERRLRAAKMAGLATIPAIVRYSNDQQAMELALVENLQRKDLNPMEEARGYHRMLKEFGYTQESIAQRIGKDRSTVANISRLVNLPPDIQTMVESGDLTAGHAKVLLGLDRLETQMKFAAQIITNQWSVRQAEQAVTGASGRVTKAKRSARSPSVYPDLEDRLRKHLGTRVNIVKTGSGGKIVLQYFSAEELNRLVESLLG
jgi:ParB family chromosome partitioning protein